MTDDCLPAGDQNELFEKELSLQTGMMRHTPVVCEFTRDQEAIDKANEVLNSF